MKSFLVTVILIAGLLGCKSSTKKQPQKMNPFVDTFRIGKKLDSVSEAEDSANELYELKANKTDGAPVKILSASFVSKTNSAYKDIQVTYKNISKKPIAAIQFRWVGINALGNPADVGQADLSDAGGGVEQDTLEVGKKQTSKWDISSRDGKKITKAWAHEVVFSDGTKWEAINPIIEKK